MDAAFWITAGAILGLLVLSGFFSGSETALTAASRGKLKSRADAGDAGAVRALRITEDNERLIGSVLLGNNLVNILAASLATSIFTQAFGESGVALATLVMTLLVLIFAEVLPKTYAITNAERAAALVSRPIGIVVRLFAPVVAAVRVLVRGLLFIVGVRTDPDAGVLAVREEIAGALELGRTEGAVRKEERDRILGALDLGDRTVEEIMLHRSKIEMIDATASPEEVLTQALESRYTRLPVFDGEPENVIGVIHAKDMLRAIFRHGGSPDTEATDLTSFELKAVLKTPYFIPETTTLDDQLRQFLRRHTHFALVVDEYGAIQGLITLEDILEEIVGEITDEYDELGDGILRKHPDGGLTVDGAMTIRDLNRAADWNLPDEEANTIAGLVIHEAQTIPGIGQVFSFHGFRFEVVDRQANRITRLRLRRL